ncbi:DUF4230 domain-containing protein [Kaistella flava (ex Peng et al. 2021)]|uniref:DUF4230 domain-containing protein n=1 Tax=Kaistella flava (ex Peng et al. 2021) TaxID=2038776 RepID=A0A7M2Y6D8_9FLAO|nr:DUF4230 domain-containing protein [Kaistella flava (ex Peng et al. 2021)]QOW08913.1 DUF4230 domain-containing protein [Kaistella flava (ex Peng et al. 2021)]
MNFSKFKIVLWSLGILMVVFLGFFIYQMTKSQNINSMMIVLMLILGLILGGVIAFLASSKLGSSPVVITESSHTIAESMRKVFKVVSAEGHFNEIYNYEETTKIFNFIPSKKKALVIVQAKVLVGYDFEKFKWEIDEVNKTVKLINFPAPQILSTETDYKYYNIEEQFFNLFSKDDLAKIQQNGKQQVIEAAKKSHLPEVAAEQMRTLLTELLAGKNFFLENASVISESKNRIDYQSPLIKDHS